MDAATILRNCRLRSGLSLRKLAEQARTSHSALAAYEARRKVPSVETLERIARAAGADIVVELRPRVGGPDPAARGRELEDVLELAAQFPARHSASLVYPQFGPHR